MKILALEASAVAASVAVVTDDRVVGEFFLDVGKTHSQTLLPMVESLLLSTDTTLAEVDFLAVSTGPGSFTGLRIAIAAVKGLALGADKPCVGVSSLAALAYNLQGFCGTACAVMDARCGQVYTALFALDGGEVTRKCPDMAISLDELGKMLMAEEKTVFLVGDGAVLCYNTLLESVKNLRLAPLHLRQQRASGVAAAAWESFRQAGSISCGELLPGYLRLPQAQRELNEKNAKTEERQAGQCLADQSKENKA